MSKKRVLVTYATAGAGHKKAAFAVKKAFEELTSDIEVDVIDSLDYTNAFFKWSYPRLYIFMVNRIPHFWSLSYYILNNRIFYSLVSWIRHLTNWINARRLVRFLRERDYDVIISTHFLVHDVVSMEGKGRIRAYLINVITDFRLHSFWIAKGVDMYAVAHEKTKDDLVSKYGISSDKIRVIGIPIDPIFSKHKDKERLVKDLSIDKGLFTVLVGSGGFGVGPIVDLVKSFKGISIPVQLLVVCGKNQKLCQSVKNLEGYVNISIKSYGFIDNMDELMEVSDVIVTKTGGMMSSESLSKGLPIIGIAPIPGQETRNFDILHKSGVALGAKRIGDVPEIITKLYNDKAYVESLKANIESTKKPNAAYDVARMAMGAIR